MLGAIIENRRWILYPLLFRCRLFILGTLLRLCTIKHGWFSMQMLMHLSCNTFFPAVYDSRQSRWHQIEWFRMHQIDTHSIFSVFQFKLENNISYMALYRENSQQECHRIARSITVCDLCFVSELCFCLLEVHLFHRMDFHLMDAHIRPCIILRKTKNKNPVLQ